MTYILPNSHSREASPLPAAAGHLLRQCGAIVRAMVRPLGTTVRGFPDAIQKAFTMAYVDPFTTRHRNHEFGTRPEDF